nr:MAG TPA: hypothetical protein [Caudoviricetes sp.]
MQLLTSVQHSPHEIIKLFWEIKYLYKTMIL